ncbi:MAG TPA: M1 family aminopeptidase [Terriglobia bacterium]|nr:M1 family aminopeptidase [Terriglobia bacterium]
MSTRACVLVLCLSYSLGARATDLATEPSEDLLKVYAQLRSLHGSTQWAVTENVEWRRDAATFTFKDGHLTFAEPVGGRVLAAYFEGQGSVQIQAPTPALQRQLGRFAGGPVLEDNFKQAVFFFTDDSAGELQKLMRFGEGANAGAAAQAFGAAEKKYAESFNGWVNNARVGNLEMRNLAARILADLTDPSSKGFFLADFKGHHHGDLIYQISWNRDNSLLPDLANDEEVMLIHYNRDQYFEWWAGFHRAEEYANAAWPEHRTLLAHCRQENVDARIAKDNRLSATASMEFEVPGGTARVLPLSLEGVLRISSIQDAVGDKLAFIQEARNLDSDPWIILPEPAAPGKVYNLKIAYEEDSTTDSRIVHQRGSGLFYVTARESWFPSFGSTDDRTRFSLHFLSPKKYKFVATGRLVKSGMEKDAYQSDWDTDIPLAVVGFNYGDFVEKDQADSNLRVAAYAGKEVPDELKGLQDAIAMADAAGGANGPHDVAGQLGITTGGFNTAANAQYAAGISFQAFKLYEYFFGQLPFKTISVTEQPVRGYAQSWPTLIFLPYDSLLDATTRHQLRLQDSPEAMEFYNVVAVHEMAHQWWGHVVGWKTYRDQWLSEGFAEFSASLYVRRLQTEKIRSYWDLKRRFLLSKNQAGHRPVDVGPLYLNFQLNAKLEPQNSFMIYAKGAYVLEMLRLLMEDPKQRDPNQRFIDMMHDFVTTYANRNASTTDFQRLVEKHMGEPMDWFFNEYVYGTEIPTYDFQYAVKPAPDGKAILQCSLTQSGVSNQFEMRVPLYLAIGKGIQRMGFIRIKGASTVPVEIPLSGRPDRISIDEYHEILAIEHQ